MAKADGRNDCFTNDNIYNFYHCGGGLSSLLSEYFDGLSVFGCRIIQFFEFTLALTIDFAKYLKMEMRNCKISKGRLFALTCVGCLSVGFHGRCDAATSAWSVDLTFNAFAGLPGGFADDSLAPQILRDQANSGSLLRSYDVVQSGAANAVTGQPTYALGQDGETDLTIRTHLLDGSAGRWAKIAAEQRQGALRMNSLVDLGTSRPGDFGVVAFEVTFSSALGVTADQLAIRLASANGSSQLYEWSMVTMGGLNDAPFTLGQIGLYNQDIYNGAAPQAAGNGDPLPTGRSISQFLAGEPASTDASGGVVTNGWWAIDDFNTQVPNGDESFGVNGGDGRIDDNQTITGGQLGFAGQPVTSFTVWFGLHDVAFDTNGDGFSLTEASPAASFTGLSFGTNLVSIPEPSSYLIFSLALGALVRRKR